VPALPSPLRADSVIVAAAACSLAAATFALAAPALAADPPPSVAALQVTRADGASACPDTASLAASVQRELGRLVIVPATGASPATLVVDIAPRGPGFAASVRTARGTRAIADPGPGCDGLADALTAALAVLLDEQLPDSPPSAPPLSELPAPAAAADRRPPRLELVGTGGAALSILPETSPALGLGARVHLGRVLALDVGALWLTGGNVTLGGGFVTTSIVAGEARLCPRLVALGEELALRACAGVAVGAVSATGHDFVSNGSTSPWWVGPLAGLELGGRFSPGSLGWLARGLISASPRSQSFYVGNSDLSTSMPSIGARLEIGLALPIL
jgi:hypothetical protein